MAKAIKTRFAPSPTGLLHVGNARTALFSWLVARHHGGRFLLRIEDTDTARNLPGAAERIAEDLRWLGLDWDEGFEVDGDAGPYRQSDRLDIYSRHVQRLLDGGVAYYAFETSDELAAMREQAQQARQTFQYPRPDPLPTQADADRARAEGRPVVVRLKMPGRDFTVRDQIMGDVTVAAAELDDFIILKADGVPTYHLAVVVDDALMGVTHVLRGQEFLAQTPRHMALQEALDLPAPTYAHLPLIMDMKGRKLSKRDGDVEVYKFREAGYLPEVMVNFLSLLGWSPGGDREKLTLDDLVELFDVGRVSRTSAKFDRDKLLAFNTDACAAAGEDRLLAGLKDYIDLNETPLKQATDDQLRQLLRANKGFRTFADIDAKSKCIFEPNEAIKYDPAAVKKVLARKDGEGYEMLNKLLPQLKDLPDWRMDTIEQLLDRVCQQHNVGLGKVAQPLRVAVAGRAVSPAIYDTLFLLGKDKTCERVTTAIKLRDD
ncbi:MAG TPA: glutamate--tRNA ligase [Phycisphaerae bacterium]|nr:glutamate--tRNA ligase [Phycisphaerae bacterium]